MSKEQEEVKVAVIAVTSILYMARLADNEYLSLEKSAAVAVDAGEALYAELSSRGYNYE